MTAREEGKGHAIQALAGALGRGAAIVPPRRGPRDLPQVHGIVEADGLPEQALMKHLRPVADR